MPLELRVVFVLYEIEQQTAARNRGALTSRRTVASRLRAHARILRHAWPGSGTAPLEEEAMTDPERLSIVRMARCVAVQAGTERGRRGRACSARCRRWAVGVTALGAASSASALGAVARRVRRGHGGAAAGTAGAAAGTRVRAARRVRRWRRRREVGGLGGNVVLAKWLGVGVVSGIAGHSRCTVSRKPSRRASRSGNAASGAR